MHSLPQKLHFTSSEMVIQLVERGRGLTDQERGLMLDPSVPPTIAACPIIKKAISCDLPFC